MFLFGGRRLYQYNEDDLYFDIDLFLGLKQHGYTKTWKQREDVNYKSFLLITCNLVV